MQAQATPDTDRRDEARRAIRQAVSQLMSEEGFRRWIERAHGSTATRSVTCS